jgi:hypothetical protein
VAYNDQRRSRFGLPMLIGTMGGLVSFILALLSGPEIRGKELVTDVVLA